MMSLVHGRRRLREMLQSAAPIVAPGAWDGLTAKAVEAAGFPAVYMTGAGTAAAAGFPDYGLLGLSEMAANVGRLAAAVTIPVIADADTGYGNELNVTRTVREYTASGAAALHLEDQVSPKRCGHLSSKEVIGRDEFVSKIAAAAEARPDPDLVLIARTDARAELGLDEAVRRANEALAAGADVAFVEAPLDRDEVKAVPGMVEGPCLLNLVGGGRTPLISVAEAAGAGYRIVIAPTVLLGTVFEACRDALDQLASTGMHPGGAAVTPVAELFRRLGSEAWDALRPRIDPPAG